MKKIAFYTLGCKLNFAETSALEDRFRSASYEVVDFSDKADVYVINTCTVTSVAEKKGRQVILQAIRRNPGAKVAVVGCFSELRPDEIAQIKGVDYVLGSADKHLIFDYIEKDRRPDTAGTEHIFHPVYSFSGRTRSFFKVQDGCDNFCSYCAIPYARGRSRSNSVAETVKMAEEIGRKGVKEIVLTGVNIGDFGRKNGENFYQLLQALVQIDDIRRYRISSIEPDLLTDEIIDLVAEHPKLMPHFHIPLQAGSDKVLKLMRRRYDTGFFAGRLERIKAKIPHAFIAVDIIAGFPAETRQDFEDAYRFVSSLPLAFLHVFAYSPRPEARSWNMESEMDVQEKEERSRRLRECSESKKETFYRQFDREVMEVLWEGDKSSEYMYAYTPNYIRVRKKYDEGCINTLTEVQLENLQKDRNKDWLFMLD